MVIDFRHEKVIKALSFILSFALIILSFSAFEIMGINLMFGISTPFIFIVGGSFLQDKRNKMNWQSVGWGLFYGSLLFFALIVILLIIASQIY